MNEEMKEDANNMENANDVENTNNIENTNNTENANNKENTNNVRNNENDESTWTKEKDAELKQLRKEVQLLNLRKTLEAERKRQEEENKRLAEEAKRKTLYEFEKNYMEEDTYSDGSIDFMDDLEDRIEINEIEGVYNNIYITSKIRITFTKPSATQLELFCYDDGLAYNFTEKDLKSKNLPKLFKSRLNKNYSIAEVVAIAETSLKAFEFLKIDKKHTDVMSSYVLVEALYRTAYYRKKDACTSLIKRNKSYVEDEDNSIATITLINDSVYGECIVINDNKKLLIELLSSLECSYDPLRMKKNFDKLGWLVKDNGNPYSCLIQTKRAKAFGVRKIIKIPVSRVEVHVKKAKEEIRNEEIRNE